MAPFMRNVFKLAGGSALGQVVLLATMPILARLYTPEHLGMVQAALSILTILLIAGALRLEIAVLSVPETELNDLFRCAWWLCLLTAGSALLLSILVALWNAEWSLEQRLLVLLLPLLGLFASWNQLMSYLGLRRHAFDPSAQAKIVHPICYSVSALGFGAIRGSSIGLLVADMAGRATASVYLGRALKITSVQLAPPDWQLLRNNLRKHRELTGIGLLAALINTAGSAFTAAMLLWLFGSFEAGQYAMVERMVGMPVGMLTAAISQVFMANLSKAVSQSDLTTAHIDFRQLIRTQVLTGVPAALVMFFIAPIALEFLLGAGWETAGTYARALTLLYLCAYISGPINMTLTVLGRQRVQLLWDCFRLLIVASTWGSIWALKLKPELALWLLSISALVTYSAYYLLADWALRHPKRDMEVSA